MRKVDLQSFFLLETSEKNMQIANLLFKKIDLHIFSLISLKKKTADQIFSSV